MGRLCECSFEEPDVKNPDYSMTEYDLYAKTGLSMRKNLKTGRYEIFVIKTGEIHYDYSDLEGIVRCANSIEGQENTRVEHGAIGCKKVKYR